MLKRLFLLLIMLLSLSSCSPPDAAIQKAIKETQLPTITTAHALDLGSTQTREKDGMLMVYVPPGSFTMGSEIGSDNEKPAHQVTLDAFWMDQTEVTNGKYARCVQTGGCLPPSNTSSSTHSSYYGNAIYAEYPVINVNWNQAKVYCEWAGARLPTEAEWEKAARGTDGRTYPWGEGIDKTKANYNQDVGDTTAVGTYPTGASPYTALDMAGNVWEWVADWYGAYSASSASNPTGPVSGDYQVLRGGSWSDIDNGNRSADRDRDGPTVTDDYGGFRCARSQ